MKTRFLKPILLLFMSLTIGINMASAQMGPVVSVSETENSIPTEIKSFINNYFPGTTMTEIQLKTMDGIYKIDLSNGYELTFLSSGQWLEIDAPKGALISTEITINLLPAASVEHLSQIGRAHV